jgi:hypothetical protein
MFENGGRSKAALALFFHPAICMSISSSCYISVRIKSSRHVCMDGPFRSIFSLRTTFEQTISPRDMQEREPLPSRVLPQLPPPFNIASYHLEKHNAVADIQLLSAYVSREGLYGAIHIYFTLHYNFHNDFLHLAGRA